MRRYGLAGLTAVLLLAQPSWSRVAADAPHYTVEDLGTIDGLTPAVTGVNDSGDVSGYVSGADGVAHAVRYRQGNGWSYVPGLQSLMSAANGINNFGDLVGDVSMPEGPRAYRFSDALGVQLIAPPAGGTFSSGLAISASGEVTGYADGPLGSIRAFRAAPGLPATPIDDFGGTFGVGCGINATGVVVGYFGTATGSQHAFRAQADGSVQDLGALDPAGTSSACAISASGEVWGQASVGVDGTTHAVRYTDQFHDIDSPGSSYSSADAVSGSTAVGMFIGADAVARAFVYTPADGMVDLNSRVPAASGWMLTTATGVNASGQIVGQGSVGSVGHAFRLTPGDTTPPVISSVTASPSSIVPPNNQMVPVAIAVVATDDSGAPPTCSVTSVTGGTANDYAISGPLTLSVRAAANRTYTVGVTCRDASGNQATASVTVVVPPDTTAPVIHSVTASPSTISVPNNQMVPVTLTVAATDDSGVAPSCLVTAVSSNSGPAGDHSITGALSASVRATANRIYTLQVTCSDGAGNHSAASASVVVLPDTTPPVITSLSVNPSTISPSDHFVQVHVNVTATDNVDAAPVCAITSITANAGSTHDAYFFGALNAAVDADWGRVYRIYVTCGDAAGNTVRGSVTVTVAKSRDEGQRIGVSSAARVLLAARPFSRFERDRDDDRGARIGDRDRDRNRDRDRDDRR